MDPSSAAITAVLGPWGPLGIVGSVVIALGLAVWRLWSSLDSKNVAHLADVKTYADKYADILVENSKTQTALANAIERIGDKIK